MDLNNLQKPFVIAEIGSNWKREPLASRDLFFRQIEDAWHAGADAVKFQYFTHKELYGIDGDDKYHLPLEWITQLSIATRVLGMEFMCTAFSPRGVNEINPYVNIHKLASSESNDGDMLAAIVATAKPFLVSLGGQDNYAVNRLASDLKHNNFSFMECVAAYPAAIEDYCLTRVGSTNHKGLSDHTEGNEIAFAAVSRGCMIFEKHFDALKDVPRGRYFDPSPDSHFSMGPQAFNQYVKGIRAIHRSLYTNLDAKSDPLMHKQWKRRLLAIKRIKKGEELIKNVNFGSFRAQKDTVLTNPNLWDKFHGKISSKDLNVGDPITNECL